MRGAAHVADWLDSKLVPLLGPASLGPFDVERPHEGTCPLCGEQLRQHLAERDGEHIFLHCPDDSHVVETGRRVA